MYKKIGTKIEALYHNTWDKRESIQKEYKWNEKDARLTVFNKANNVLRSVDLGYLLIHLYLQKKDWWETYEQLNANQKSIKSSVEEFEMFFRIGLIQNLTYCIESSFRVFVRSLDSSACDSGGTDFKNVYDWLFKKLNLQQHTDLFDLWRNIRNVMHNNGIFMPKNRKAQKIVYKKVSYSFKPGKPISFLTVDLIIELASDLSNAVVDVVSASPLSDKIHIPDKT